MPGSTVSILHRHNELSSLIFQPPLIPRTFPIARIRSLKLAANEFPVISDSVVDLPGFQ